MLRKIGVMIFEECKPDTDNYYLNVSTENPSKIHHLFLRKKNVLALKLVMKLMSKQKNKS